MEQPAKAPTDNRPFKRGDQVSFITQFGDPNAIVGDIMAVSTKYPAKALVWFKTVGNARAFGTGKALWVELGDLFRIEEQTPQYQARMIPKDDDYSDTGASF